MAKNNTTTNDELLDDERDTDEVDEDEEDQSEEDTLATPTRRAAVWVYTINLGGGNEGDQQVQALFAPRYQLARRGISFVTSPRHANVVLLTGTLTRSALPAVQATLAAVPDPRAIVAVGDSVLTGGVFAGSDEVVPDAADLLDVNVNVFGDPPSPVQIVRGIEEAARLLDDAESGTDEATEDGEETDESEEAVDDDVMEEEDV